MTYYGQAPTSHSPEWESPQKVVSSESVDSGCDQVWSSLADLPAPVAGVITIDQSGAFCVPGILDLQGNRLQYNAGSEIKVQGFGAVTSEIRSTGLAANQPLITTSPGTDQTFEQIHLRHSSGGICVRALSGVNQTVEFYLVRFSGEPLAVNSGIGVSPSGGSISLYSCELKNLESGINTSEAADTIILEGCDIQQCVSAVHVESAVQSLSVIGNDFRQCTTAILIEEDDGSIERHTCGFNTFSQCTSVFGMITAGAVTHATVDGNQYRQVVSAYAGAGFDSVGGPEQTAGWFFTVPCTQDVGGVRPVTGSLNDKAWGATSIGPGTTFLNPGAAESASVGSEIQISTSKPTRVQKISVVQNSTANGVMKYTFRVDGAVMSPSLELTVAENEKIASFSLAESNSIAEDSLLSVEAESVSGQRPGDALVVVT